MTKTPMLAAFVIILLLVAGCDPSAQVEPAAAVAINPTATTPLPTPTPILECADPEPSPGQPELLRYPDRYANKCLLIDGVVIDVNTNDLGIDVWVDTSSNTNVGGWVVVYGPLKCFRDEGRVLVGDRVSTKVRMLNTPFEYGSVGAGVLEVPIGSCVK